jgi:hypothetical protein
MSSFVLAQIIGATGLLLALSVFQVNKRKSMLKIGISASMLYTIQYILLGAFTGAAMNVVGTTRGYVYYKVIPSKKHRWVLLTFIGVACLGALFTWEGPISWLALAGSICGGFSVWHKNPKYIRRWALLGPPLWFAYNGISGSYPGMVSEVIMLSSNLMGEYRFDFKHPIHAKRRFAHVA